MNIILPEVVTKRLGFVVPTKLYGVPRGPKGPVAWCNTCSRKHERRDCNLVTVQRKTKRHYDKDGNFIRGGKPVVRLAHPRSIRKKTRARRT